jgi:uncharacterized membrane-anchored protein
MQHDLQNKSNGLINKVANITIFFWVIKILSTTVGEASADFFGHHFGPVSAIVAFVLLMASIIIQIRFKRYVPWMYWTVIVLVAVFGTMFADGIHHLGVPLVVSTIGFIILLLGALGVWYASEKTLDVHSIYTTKREIFYWTVIFFTFALGTAAGDLVADGFHLGYLDATLVFGAVIIVIPLILYKLKINNIALFWITYILTRPFGAAGADLLGKPVSHGGLGLGAGTTSLITLAMMIVLVVWLSITHKKEMLLEEQVKLPQD